MTRLPVAGLVNVTATLAFAALILIQIAGGATNYPTIPPGVVISVVVVAVLIWGARWWWTAILAALWPLFLAVGAIVSGVVGGNFADLHGPFQVVTTVIQMSALAVAL